jgi:hypothetical protein
MGVCFFGLLLEGTQNTDRVAYRRRAQFKSRPRCGMGLTIAFPSCHLLALNRLLSPEQLITGLMVVMGGSLRPPAA